MRHAIFFIAPPPNFAEPSDPDPRLGEAVARVVVSTLAHSVLRRVVEFVSALYLRVLLARLRDGARAYAVYGFGEEAEQQRVSAFLVSLIIAKRKRRRR